MDRIENSFEEKTLEYDEKEIDEFIKLVINFKKANKRTIS